MSEMYMIKDTQINFRKRWNGCIFVEFDFDSKRIKNSRYTRDAV